ncbi:MAG TPA: hypothetical protein VNE63_05405 [Candidatus Acidoferrales bacterium]|nr:hypothetical protein [Candidatus Acidoferrales bacterium]
MSDHKDTNMGRRESAIDRWMYLRDQFRALSEEGGRKNFDLGRFSEMNRGFGREKGPTIWEQGGIIDIDAGVRPTGEFVARFEALATRAALGLEVPKGKALLHFWLESVQGITTSFNDLCEASATFCSHLERHALEKATEKSSAVGRPRVKDEERKKIREMKEAGKTWKEIAAKMNEDTGQDKSPEAYRSLLGSPRTRKP